MLEVVQVDLQNELKEELVPGALVVESDDDVAMEPRQLRLEMCSRPGSWFAEYGDRSE